MKSNQKHIGKIGWLVGVGFFVITTITVPHRWCNQAAVSWYAGDFQQQLKFAKGVEQWIQNDLDRKDFKTGNTQYSGEWLFGAYMMAGMGFGQMAEEHPEFKPKAIELMNTCIDRLLAPRVRAFDRESWNGHDPLETLDANEDHAAYLGYLNLLLSYHRLLDPNSRHAILNDKITSALTRRLEKNQYLLLETYPGEIYPVDNCAVIASIGLYDRATKSDHSKLLKAWADRCREKYIDKESGILYQYVDPYDGIPKDSPRGSGTTLGAYYLSFYDPTLSKELYDASKKQLYHTVLGFGVMDEYPKSEPQGHGDIDSGPVVFGIGLSPTGFMMGCARAHKDPEVYQKIYGTSHLFGAPFEHDGKFEYVTGGPLGNAIMFAMITAKPMKGTL